MVDIIYPIRNGENNPELKYSLRSIAKNLPHEQVWIVGYMPSWVKNCHFIKGNDLPHLENANVWRNIKLACANENICPDSIIMNDDFYITCPKKSEDIFSSYFYRCTLQEHISNPRVQALNDWWLKSLQLTSKLLIDFGIDDPLSYELHIPFAIYKPYMAKIIEKFEDKYNIYHPPQWRTLYGNVVLAKTGTQTPDVKVYGNRHNMNHPLIKPFHSTTKRSFSQFKKQLDEMFPEKCKYEA